MNPNCEKIRRVLAEEGPGAFRGDEQAQQHLAECAGCFALMESLSELDAGFAALTPLDAPDHVVDALLARPEIAAGPAPSTGRPGSFWSPIAAVLARLTRPRTFVWATTGAAAVLLVVAVTLRDQISRQVPGEFVAVNKDQIVPTQEIGDELKNNRDLSEEELEMLRSLGYVEGAPVNVDRQAEPDKKEGRKHPGAYENDGKGELNLIGDLPVPQRFGEHSKVAEVDAVGQDKGDLRFDADPSDAPEARPYQHVLTFAPGVQDPDGYEDDARSRDLKTVVGGASNVDPFNGERVEHANPNSIEEIEVVASAPTIDLDKSESSVRSSFAADNEASAAKPKSKTESERANEPRLQRRLPPPPPLPETVPPRSSNQAPANGPLLPGVGGVTMPVPIAETRVEPDYPEMARVARIEANVVLQVVVRKDGTVSGVEVLECSRPNLGFEQAAVTAVEQWRYEPATVNGRPVDIYFTVKVNFKLDEPSKQGSISPGPARNAALAFLAERESLEGLSFKPARGYWSNTYVPGDPILRLLQSRLEGLDLRQHDASRPAAQPFDAPESSALAIYLHADRRGTAAGGRTLLQVGIKGTPRHGGRRPAMNLAVVVDMPDAVSDPTAIALRALLDALNAAQEPGDRFRLIAANRCGDPQVAPEDFRHGYLKVTLDRLLDESDSRECASLDVVEAVAAAVRVVAIGDDPKAPLGSSAVLLVTADALGADTGTLASLAHQSAVAGVPMSVVGLGRDVNLSEMDRIALAGQGSRRHLQQASRAVELVDRELSAASRAVARAVRLRIRLAPGVKLIDVLGSERLDERRTEKVREAERSLDLRLARNLGIEADRGEDEEGIQIVIPSFYAGDAHVILLDVAVDGPGPIADVTARYKDLVYLRNGVERASVALDNRPQRPGPLERNVLKNLLSWELSRTLYAACRALVAADPLLASRLIRNHATLLAGLRIEVPGLSGDPDLADDLAMLEDYRIVLASGDATAARLAQLRDSLHFAALMKTLPRSSETRS